MINAGIETGFGDEWIKFGATSEHTVDGSFSERTMALSARRIPACTPPYKGNVTETQDTLNAWVERVHRAGIQVNCHANGDVAIDMYLTAMERAQKLAPRADARPKITHCTLINPSLIARIKALGAVPALFTTYAYYNTDKFVFYGEEMMKNCMAFRSLLDAGINACAGSDFSPGPFAPLMGIQGMVTRKAGTARCGAPISGSASARRSRSIPSTARRRQARKRSRGRSPPASSPTTSCSPTIRTPSTSRRSRTSRSCARSSAGRSRTRRSSGAEQRTS